MFELDESVLDDADRLLAADPEDSLRVLAGAGAQLRRTRTAADEAGVGALAGDGLPRALVVLGTGVAGLAADALVALAGPEVPVPIVVHPDGELPRWVGAADMVVGLSPSGAGAGAILAAEAAAGRGARVVGVGGDASPLAAAVSRARGPFVTIAPAASRRFAFWPLLTGLLTLVRAVGLVDMPDEVLAQCADRLDEEAVAARPDSDAFVNPAKQLALQLAGTVPAVWGCSRLTGVVARRFGESLAAAAGYPASHATLDGVSADCFGLLGGPYAGAANEDDLFRDRIDEPEATRLHVVLLRGGGADPTADAVRELAMRYRAGLSEVRADGGPPLVQLAQLVGSLDFTAAYLALLHGIDPGREVGGPA